MLKVWTHLSLQLFRIKAWWIYKPWVYLFSHVSALSLLCYFGYSLLRLLSVFERTQIWYIKKHFASLFPLLHSVIEKDVLIGKCYKILILFIIKSLRMFQDDLLWYILSRIITLYQKWWLGLKDSDRDQRFWKLCTVYFWFSARCRTQGFTTFSCMRLGTKASVCSLFLFLEDKLCCKHWKARTKQMWEY